MEKWKENKAKYNLEYKRKNMKRVPLDMPNNDYVTLKEHTVAMGETVNGFIKRAIRETMERDRQNSDSV